MTTKQIQEKIEAMAKDLGNTYNVTITVGFVFNRVWLGINNHPSCFYYKSVDAAVRAIQTAPKFGSFTMMWEHLSDLGYCD
jgi:hypothetical protein